MDRAAPRGSFRADVAMLMTGMALGQILLLAVSPLLTRLFTPAAFGAFGVFLSLAAIMNALSTLRFDQAIMLPREAEEASPLFWAALLSAVAVGAASLVACLLFFGRILSVLKVEALSGWILVLPLAIFFNGSFQALIAWSTRHKKFARQSFSQVARSLAIVVVQVVAGALRSGPGGLVGGAVAGDACAAAVLAWQVRREDGAVLSRGLNWPKIKAAAREYRDFPLFSSTQNFLNAISQNIPLLLLANYFGPAVAGFYVLAVRGIQVPMNFFLTSLRQVFFQKASELYNQGGDAWGLFRSMTLRLGKLVALPSLAVFLFGPRLFAFALGGRWLTAGVYARWLVPWLALMFANVPAVLFAQILRRQKAVLLIDVALLASRVLAIVAGGLRRDPLLAVVLYSLVGVAVNLYIILWVGGLLRREKRA
jgi:O-antigen/teichoic acid export membrane protein